MDVANRGVGQGETEKLLKLLEEEISLDGDALSRLLKEERIDKLKLISENTNDIVCLHHPSDFRYLYASPSAEKLMGYTSKDLEGKVPNDFIHPDQLQTLSENLSETKEGENSSTKKLELKFRLKDNTYQWFEGYTTPIHDKNGNIILILSLTRNIQDRKIAEMEKREREIIQQNLLSYSILFEKKRAIMKKLEDKILEVEPKIRGELRSVLTYIRETLQFDEDWEDFMVHFKNIHPDFYDSISSRYPDLSKTDLQHLAFIKLGMSSTEISNLRMIKKSSLRVIRNRLKRKLKLEPSQDLIKFIRSY